MLFSDILWLQQWCEEPYVICLIHCWIKTLQQQQLRYTIQKYRNCNVSIHYTAVADTMMRPCRPISSYNAGCSKNRHHFVQPLIFFCVSSKEKEWSQTRKVLMKQMRLTSSISSWKKVSQPSLRPCHTSCPWQEKNIPTYLKLKMWHLRFLNFPSKNENAQKLENSEWRHEGCV